jgi:cobalt transporter subunit CbtB
MTHIQQTAPAVTVSSDVRAGRRLQAAMAISLGLFVIGFVGFSHLEIVHNAAHDTRHANAFPCH